MALSLAHRERRPAGAALNGSLRRTNAAYAFAPTKGKACDICGLPTALGGSSIGAKAVAGRIGSIFSLGLSFADRMGLDVAFTGAEAVDCSMTF